MHIRTSAINMIIDRTTNDGIVRSVYCKKHSCTKENKPAIQLATKSKDIRVPYYVIANEVRMAERSKAPDSSVQACLLLGFLVHLCGRGFESHF